MSNDEMQNHATISRAGEVEFPQWVKVLAWIFGLLVPIGMVAGTWMMATVFDMSVRMARMEGALTIAAEDRYRASQAEDAHELLQDRITRNAEGILELQALHGRGSSRRQPENTP